MGCLDDSHQEWSQQNSAVTGGKAILAGADCDRQRIDHLLKSDPRLN